jgi:hypothetical protein
MGDCPPPGNPFYAPRSMRIEPDWWQSEKRFPYVAGTLYAGAS